MNATKCLARRAGLLVCSTLAVALTGCRTQIVHAPPRVVYVPAPPPPVVYSPPAPAPQPPPVVVVPPPAQPPVVVIQSANDFYEPLAAYGRWEMVGSYGRCWIPARVEAGWRPYSSGYWQRTDAGWYWATDEPWGWATYHYGRWDFHPQFGWIWVPQTQWAPAWVAWREGGGYVGWAPLRPSVAIGVSVGAVNYEPAFASRAFVFVEHRRMLEPVRPKTVIVNNTTIINNTVNITNVKVVNKTVINEGPRPEVIERESGRKVRAVPARDIRRQEEETVVARQRNIPTAPEGKVQSPARTETQVAPKQALLPRNAHVDEKPVSVVTPSERPLATPARPTSPPIATGRPARVENRPAAEAAKKIATPPPTVVPQAKPVVAAPQPVPLRREVRPLEKPAVATQPTPPAINPSPVREGKGREAAIEKKNIATPPAVDPKSRPAVKPETRQGAKRPVQVETVPPSAARGQTAPTSAKPADQRPISPSEKSRASEQAEANKKKDGDKASRNRETFPADESKVRP